MVIKGEDKYTKLIINNCDCGCDTQIQIKKIKDTDEYYMAIGTNTFYSEQRGLFKTILRRLKIIGLTLIGKEYKLCEIVLTKEDLNDLIKDLSWIKDLNNTTKKKEVLLESR